MSWTQLFLAEVSESNSIIIELGSIQVNFENEYDELSNLLNQYIEEKSSISLNSINTVRIYIRKEYKSYKKKITDLLGDGRLELNDKDKELQDEIDIEKSRFDHITTLMKKAKLL